MNRNYLTHISSLTLTKTADGLIDPKLVLSWLLNNIGAPGFLIGLLVPVREAGALLPQLLLARVIQRADIRKYFWAAGAAVQGLAALGIAAAALTLPGAVAGRVIIGLLAVLAVACSACSASYKDVLSRTVEKGTRGRVSGSAGTLAAIVVFAFAIALSLGWLDRTALVISSAIAVAGVLWLIGALAFTTLNEPADEGASDADVSAQGLLKPLREDPEFRTYIATRAQLISTALAPPFLVMLGSGAGDAGFGNLGLLVLASSIASSYLWGSLSDWSSRHSLMLAGALSGAVFIAAALAGYLGLIDGAGWLIAAFVFVGQIAYQGARSGRKTHLADMDSDGQKSVYTALSNTMIGTLLLLGGVFGLLADLAGPALVLGLLGLLSLSAIFTAYHLSEVQQDA